MAGGMVSNNAFILLIGMLFKMVKNLNLLHNFKKILAVFLMISIQSCASFYNPMFMSMEIPDGPPEFQAGWYDGCRTGLATKKSTNASVYSPSFGSGIYQHDEVYQSAWSSAFYSCAVISGRATSDNIFDKGPAD